MGLSSGLMSLRHKVDYVSEHLPGPETRLISECIRTEISSTPALANMPALTNQLELDILYAIARHRMFVGLDVLRDIMIDFIASEFRLTREIALRTVDSSLKEASRWIPAIRDRRDAVESRRFLRHIFVEAAVAGSEDELLSDLGLGRGLLRRLRAGAEAVVTSGRDSQGDHPHFVPEMDAWFGEIMVDMSRELRRNALALEHARLDFALTNLGDSKREILDDIGISRCFEILMLIGQAVRMRDDVLAADLTWLADSAGAAENLHRDSDDSSAQLRDEANGSPKKRAGASRKSTRKSPSRTSPRALARLDKILHALADAGLVFVAEQLPRINRKVTVWSLSAAAEQLTAHAFATSCGWTSQFLTGETANSTIFSLAPAWQKALMQRWPSSGREALARLLAHEPTRLSRAGLEAAMHRAARILEPKAFLIIAGRMIESSAPAWARNATVEACGRLTHDTDVAQLITQVAKSDPSIRMRQLALEKLLVPTASSSATA